MFKLQIEGIPVSGGSKTAVFFRQKKGAAVSHRPKFAMVDTADMRKNDPGARKRWMNLISTMATKHFTDEMIMGAVILKMDFFMPHPKSHYRGGKYSHLLKDSAPKEHIVKPDEDKLLRPAQDALSGICWKDDCQIISVAVTKQYTERGKEGVDIYISTPEELSCSNSGAIECQDLGKQLQQVSSH